jgi:hypothetical protein
MLSTNLRLHEKGQACRQEHERFHIGDYSPTELVVDVDEDEYPARNYFHAGSIRWVVMEEASYVLFDIVDEQTRANN